MISWIQNHLIRHGRWIFLTLLSLIIVAFVFTIGNTPGCTSDSSGYQARHFYGYDLNSPRDMTALSEKVSLSAHLSGQQLRDEQQFQSQAMTRIALLHVADEIGVPHPTETELREYIRTKRAFAGPDGAFSPDAYTRFVDNLESNPRAPKDLFIAVLEEDFRMEQLAEAFAGPGYLLPSEARVQTQRNQTTFELATATLNYNDFNPEIAPTEATLRTYYENNTGHYEIAERIEASYILFPTEQFSNANTEVAESELRAHFVANRSRFVAQYEAAQPQPEQNDVDSADENNETDAEPAEKPAVTFEDARSIVANDFNREAAKRSANQAAHDFALKLYNEKIARDSDTFNQLLEEAGLKRETIPPYTADETARREFPKEMLDSAFILSKQRYFSDPYPVKNGYAVLIYEGRIDPVVPPFEEVAGVVEADYLAEEKRRLFTEEGERLHNELQTAVSDERDFVEAAKNLDMQAEAHEAFKAAEAPRTLNPSVVQHAQSMQAGEVSQMIVNRNVGTIVYVANKEVPEIAADDESFTQAREFLTYIGSSISSGAFINELITQGLPADAFEGE